MSRACTANPPFMPPGMTLTAATPRSRAISNASRPSMTLDPEIATMGKVGEQGMHLRYQLRSVRAWHAQVGDDGVGAVPLDDIEASVAEAQRDRVTNKDVVVDQTNVAHGNIRARIVSSIVKTCSNCLVRQGKSKRRLRLVACGVSAKKTSGSSRFLAQK